MNRTFRLIVLCVAVFALLLVGARRSHTQTLSEKVASVGSQIRCPVCESQSVTESDSNAAIAARSEIRKRLQQGESTTEIKQYFASRYGNDILLSPGTSNWSWLVWVLPLAVLTAGGSLFAVAATRNRTRRSVNLNEHERAEIEKALGL